MESDMNIKITADSTCDLSPELVAANNIQIIPLYIIKGGVSYRDGIDITPKDIFEYVDSGKELCGTAAVSVGDYTEIFTELRKEYDAVIHFTISSEMSSCYQNAVMAAETVDQVYVVDSRNLSTGIGQLALEACRMAREGMAPQDIKAECDRLAAKLDVSFILNTLVYLYKGGRCSAVAALGANLLGLKPCIEVKNGKMGVGKKYRGSLEKVLAKYVEDKLADTDTLDDRRIFITFSTMPESCVKAAEDAVRRCFPFKEVLRTTAGSTISNHCGPACLGILFFRK